MVLLFLAIAIIWGIATFPYERLLLKQATRICSIRDWSAEDAVDYTHYHWLANDLLLYETTAGAHVLPWQADAHICLWQLNIRTGNIQQNTPFLAMQEACPIHVYSFSLSPDRQWALWQTWNQNHFLNIVARVDGGVSHTWKIPQDPIYARYTDTEWLEQEHRCIELVSDLEGIYKQARMRSAENLSSVTRYLIAEHSRFNDTGFSTLGVTKVSNGHVLRYNGERDEETGKWRLVDIDLTHIPWQEQTYWLTLPTNTDVYAFYFHPRQKRVALLMAYPTTVAWTAFIHRFLNRLPLRTEWRLGLWVADWNGEYFHEIGHIPITQPDVFTSPITQVAWLPDDKHISFVYRNSLYSVSSEP